MSSQITLDEYAHIIVKPMVLESIKAGRLDDVIADPDVWSIIVKDQDILKATVERLQFLVTNPPQSVFTDVVNEVAPISALNRQPNIRYARFNPFSF